MAKTRKQRSASYDPKLKVKGSFESIIAASVKRTDTDLKKGALKKSKGG